MIKLIRKSQGVSYIELLLYMGLLSIFLLLITNIFISILDVQAESQSTSSVEQGGRFLISRLSYDMNRADLVTTPTSLGQTTNSLSLNIGGVSYTYSLSGSNLQLVNNNGTDSLNDSETSISNISFQRLGNSGGKDTIKIQFTITSRTVRSKGSETKTFQTTVGRR